MKNIGYIGFSDAWGDLVYNGAKAAEADDGIKVLTNERYARVDTSVTGQILKVLAVRPDAVLIGGSGTQGALPLLALGERGFKGKTYGTVALVNPDFVRVGGKAAEGIQVSAGPVIVAEQLPDDHFAKKLALEFRKALRDEILNTKELSGVHAVYNFKPGAYYGVDERALVIVRLVNGAWTYQP